MQRQIKTISYQQEIVFVLFNRVSLCSSLCWVGMASQSQVCWYQTLQRMMIGASAISKTKMLVHSTASWLPNQMISRVLIFGFLCRSSIFRYPDDLRNIVQQCACVSRNCRQHRFQLWSSCGNRKSWRKNLQPRRFFNRSISSLPISVRFVCVYLSVCICICISTGPSAVYPPPSLEDSYLPESAFSPDEEGSSSYGEPEYNFEYELTEPLLKEVWQK